MKKDRFEKILLHYGAHILCRVLDYAKKNELYEDCAEIAAVLSKYNIPEGITLHDWECELWRFGYSGEIALYNVSEYYNNAMNVAGYINKQELIDV